MKAEETKAEEKKTEERRREKHKKNVGLKLEVEPSVIVEWVPKRM